VAEGKIQIEPYISRPLKERLDAERQERKVKVGDIVEAALRQYFGLTEEREDKIDVVLRQNRQMLAMLSELAAHAGISLDAIETKLYVAPLQEETSERKQVGVSNGIAPPVDILHQYRSVYGNDWIDETEPQGRAGAESPPPRLTGWRRLVYKPRREE
jgi:hypothetical protein